MSPQAIKAKLISEGRSIGPRRPQREQADVELEPFDLPEGKSMYALSLACSVQTFTARIAYNTVSIKPPNKPFNPLYSDFQAQLN